VIRSSEMVWKGIAFKTTVMGSSGALGHTVFSLVIWQIAHPLT
jgi:hypothetical protein